MHYFTKTCFKAAMAMEGELGSLSGEMVENVVSGEMEDTVTTTDQNQKDTATKNESKEDLDGLQMLRLPQEEQRKQEIEPTLFEHESLVEEPKVEEDHSIKRIALKHKGVDGGAVKPALVKKEVSELHVLTERQQKILQDFHVKFVLEGVSVEEDDESRALKHSEFVELKKRLEEEEKMYAGCALGEPSDIIDEVDIKPSTMAAAATTTTVEEDEDEHTSDAAASATMDGVISSLADIAICRPNLEEEEDDDDDVKPQLRPQVVRNSLKGLVDDDDDDGLSELQEYTNREGSGGCQCCCRKAGKQIDEGEDNDVYMTHSSYSVLNVVCPVSGMPVVNLEDPVRSEECEHIYDRSSALNYIASMAKDGFCLCASPGCRALLAENKLVTDSRLWQDIEELRQIKAAMWESRMLQDLVNIDDSDDED